MKVLPDSNNWEYMAFNNGSKYFDEAYFKTVKDTVCPDGVLALEYDAAHVIMGGDWRMPTNAEMQELIDNTDHSWVTNYQGSGIKGSMFVSKTDSSKSIFIPAAGYRIGSKTSEQNTAAGLWSSSLHEEILYDAWRFNSYQYVDIMDNTSMAKVQRNTGACIRGVIA